MRKGKCGETNRRVCSGPRIIVGSREDGCQIDTSLFRHHGSDERLKNLEAISSTQFRLRRTLRVRHHAQDVASFTADARDVFERNGGINLARDLARWRRVAKHDTPIALQISQRGFIAKVIPLHMPNRDRQNFAFAAGIGKWRIRSFDSHFYRLAHILQTDTAPESARAEPGVREDM